MSRVIQVSPDPSSPCEGAATPDYSGKGEDSYVVIIIVSPLNTNEEVRWLDLPEHIPEYHISETGSTCRDGEKTFYIEILAELANNKTEIQCKY